MQRMFAIGMAAGLFVLLGATAPGAGPAPADPPAGLLAALPAERVKDSPSAEQKDERPARRRLTPCLAGAWPAALARCMASPAGPPTRHA
jgi:hypothetical protein